METEVLITVMRVSHTSRIFIKMASGLLRCCILAVKEKTPSESSRSQQFHQRLQELLDKIVQGENEEEAFDKFSERVLLFLRNRIDMVTKGLTCNSSKRTKIWSDFHQIRLDTSSTIHSEWKELVEGINGSADLAGDALLQQSLYNEVYSMLVSEYFNLHAACNTEPMAISTVLTEDELNAMRYACGYVPHALLKKYETRCGDVYSEYVQCLGDMAIEGEGDDVLAYTRKWMDQVNRGGLFPLNDNSFSFFVEVEKIVRVLLPKYVIHTDNDKVTFKKSVLDKITKNDHVQFYWTLLSQEIHNQENSEALLTEVVTLWVTIRGFSLAASWMEAYKKNKQKTTQKATGLRKSISGTS